jgi:hypothetical protein
MSYYDGLAPSAGHVYVGARETQQDSRPRASYQLPELAALVARAPSSEKRKREELPTAEAVMVYEQSPLGGDRFWPDGARLYPIQRCVRVSYVARNMPNFSLSGRDGDKVNTRMITWSLHSIARLPRTYPTLR